MNLLSRLRCNKCGWIAITGLFFLVGLNGCGEKVSTMAEPDPVGGPALVRRLTESQYRATVADVFGPNIPVVARFERGLRSEGLLAIGSGEAGISPFSVEQYDVAARGVATAVVSEQYRKTSVPCEPKSATEFDEVCATRFVELYAPRLLRRPVQHDEVVRYVGFAQQAQSRLGDFYEGLKYALTGIMLSPEFVLRIEHSEPDSKRSRIYRLDAFSKATRLSYFLTNSTPDDELLRAAGAGELDTEKGLSKQVDRLIATPHFESAVRDFFKDMLEFDLFDDLAKDPAIYPAFNSMVAADAQEQTLRTITNQLIKENGDYRDLFTTRKAYLTRSLGVVYRLPVPTRNGWEDSLFPEESGRSGIQNHVSFLALHSHPGRSSATLRGKAIRQVFLCQEVPDPPANVNFTAVNETSSVSMPTARDRLHLHNTQPACAGCHKIMDPPGFALENFDGLGTRRIEENGAVIDASGSLDGFEFKDPESFAKALHDHPETPRCLVEKIYRYAVGRDTVWQERAYMDWLLAEFKANGYRVPQLMRTVALSENFFAIQAPASVAEKSTAATEKSTAITETTSAKSPTQSEPRS